MSAAALLFALLAGAGPGESSVATPKTEATLPPPACRDVGVRDQLAVLAQTGGIVTLDLKDPAHPRELGRLGLHATVVRVAFAGNEAWLAAGAWGVARVDLEDPAAPRLLQRLDVTGKVADVLPMGSRLLVAESRDGLSVWDVSLPDRPKRTASVPTRGEVVAVALDGSRLATAEELAGVRLFDLEHPDTPRELATVEIEGARDVAFVEGRLVVAAGKRGLVVLSLDEPRAPRITAEFPPPEKSALAVAPFGKLALVAGGAAGVQVVDPAGGEGGARALRTVRISSRHAAFGVAASGTTVLVAAGELGFAVLDLSNLDDPKVLYPTGRRMRIEGP